MPRRPAPTPLRLHPGPTPPRNHPKFTLPSMPQQSFYPVATQSVPVVKKELKYIPSRGHRRSSSSSSSSSVGSDDEALAFATDVVRGGGLVPPMQSLPPVMTRGPRPKNDGGMAMPEFKASNTLNSSVRSIQIMGPWEYSRLRLSEQEIRAMIAPPKRAIANPCPVSW
ncbi:hypothetical protein M408DRAFT_327218 [Serendipita vermifera MAFF 305830]|uniref:Uncharacterized protein n=1 Tax=Serendipita vermifera MAFF 305830 TaxID=933852 RepID=A0A0C3BI40_SERVB|nr:hypothetical protein M408DRAFT_327218 [Serendipita vermifera MAFF 305830]